ncbi:MAG: DUF1294 domain-containing protein [Gammaproteobacteria bacterium]|nr:DUF1294 domain-containing protein [Gammaproteobacteria bacterium]
MADPEYSFTSRRLRAEAGAPYKATSFRTRPPKTTREGPTQLTPRSVAARRSVAPGRKVARWRTKEATLQLIGLVGGWPGALIAQESLRHKSRKMSFQVVFAISVVLNGVALVWLHTADGQVFLRKLLSLIRQLLSTI